MSPASSTVDALAGSLRERILDGELKPGTPLREEALSGEYDVARHSLRSALRTLQGEGIVEIEPNRGARVKSLSPEDVRSLSELRIALELEAARMVLTRDAVQQSDVVITMGCGDACPIFPGKRYEDWELPDPAGQGVEAVRPIRDDIRGRVEELIASLEVEQIR